MAGKTKPYQEGDLFAVPLDDGGFAIGLVAREKDDLVLGYFFDGIHETPPSVDDVVADRDDAIEITRFGDDGLRNGTWPILGPLPGWHRDSWPIPWFVNGQQAARRPVSSYYPNDPTRSLGLRWVPAADAASLPLSSMSPWRAQELGLNQMLHHDPKPLPRWTVIPGPPEPVGHPHATSVMATDNEEAVRVYFRTPKKGLSGTQLHAMEEFEDDIDGALRLRRLGYVDGNEHGDGEYVIYLYGPSRDALWARTQQLLV